MLLKILDYYLIVGGIVLILLGMSCTNNLSKELDNQTISMTLIESYLSKGQLKELFNSTDTLKISINLSGSIFRRIDLVSFFKIQDTIYIKSVINLKLDNDSTIYCKIKKYNGLDDTSNFESLITKIQEIQTNKLDTSDSKVTISIGVQKKWGYNYSFNKNDKDFLEIKDRYLNIMNRIYPEIDEYKEFEKLVIIDEIE